MLNRLLFTVFKRRIPASRRNPYNVFFVLFSLSGIAFLALMVPIFYSLERHAIAHTALLLALGMAINLGLWRLGMSGFWGQTLFEAMMIAAVAYCAWSTGGVASPFMIFLSLVPLLPVFTTRKRKWVLFWLFVTVMTVASLLVLQLKGIAPIDQHQSAEDLMVYAVIYCGLCVLQWVLISTQDQANRATTRKIRGANVRLQGLSNALRLANAHKDQFLATVSHELRTPLNAVIGYLSLAGSHQAAKGELRQLVLHAQNSAAHLVTVINDLLDFSQIQNGSITLNPQDFNLHAMLQDTHSMLQLRAADRQLSYTLHLADNVPEWIKADQHRLRQMLINLLSNAVKFTAQGEVALEVHYQVEPQQPNTGQLQFDVRDTGPGIAQSELALIFEPFVQLMRQERRGPGTDALHGNGLGLSITNILAKSHGGQLRVQSTPGQGSIFTLLIPISLAHAPTQIPLAMEHGDPRPFKILVVDDHEVNRLVVRSTLLRSFPQALIEEACNGVEGLGRIASARFDLVLADLLMPEMDGIEMARRVRQTLPSPAREVFIMALTANVTAEALQDCKDVGMQEVMAKPFDRNTLIARVLHYCERSWHLRGPDPRQRTLGLEVDDPSP